MFDNYWVFHAEFNTNDDNNDSLWDFSVRYVLCVLARFSKTRESCKCTKRVINSNKMTDESNVSGHVYGKWQLFCWVWISMRRRQNYATI